MADGRRGIASRESNAREGGAYARMAHLAPPVIEAYQRLGDCVGASGPLDEAGVATIKVAMSVGLGSWRGVHAHARKALEAGVSAEILRQVAMVAVPTTGLHGALDALRWIEEVIEERGKTNGRPRAATKPRARPGPRRQAAGGRR